jgi:methionyl-tRNA formyltransferase
MVRALDAGPMVARVARPIGQQETSEDVERDLARIGAALLVSTLDAILNGSAVEIPQNDSEATYASRLTKEDGVIDWTQPAQAVHNLIRGLHPWPHAFTFHRRSRLILLKSHPGHDGVSEGPGTVLAAEGDRLRIAAGSGFLDVLELQAEGRRPLPTRAFLAGYPLSSGDRLMPAP